MKKLAMNFNRVIFAPLFALLLSMAFVSCNSDEPEVPSNPDDDESDLYNCELTLIGGTYYDGTNIFDSDSKYKSLKMILEPQGENHTGVYGKYTEKYGSKTEGTGTYSIDEDAEVLTINASTYLTNDWGKTYNYTENESGTIVTLSPTGWEEQQFVFSVKVY